MKFRELFNVPVVVVKAPVAAPDRRQQAPRDMYAPPGGTAAETEIQRQGAFITVQSLVTFPGAVAAVTAIVNVAGWAVPRWAGKPALFAIAAALVGLAIYFINESDPKKPPSSGTRRLVAIFIAALNTIVILTAAVGADVMIRNSGMPQVEVPAKETVNGTE